VNTLAVANNPNAVTQPESTCATAASTVIRGAVDIASDTTIAADRGTARTVCHSVADATFSSTAAHRGGSRLSTPMSGLGTGSSAVSSAIVGESGQADGSSVIVSTLAG
jgi:hypothetical protein